MEENASAKKGILTPVKLRAVPRVVSCIEKDKEEGAMSQGNWPGWGPG
jgi:hypothetical protein